MKKIMLLGSGELGKEFAISAKYLGHTVIALDNYANAPAMQVSDVAVVVDMLDRQALTEAIQEHDPDIIVPEVEAIATEALYAFEDAGKQVVPSARAVNLTMNRDYIRNRASHLGLRTAKFAYAENYVEFHKQVITMGLPCVVKPVMSSSGKGQSVVRKGSDIQPAWEYAMQGMRGDRRKVIVEEFIDFSFEVTLLTVKQKDDPTVFCVPIEHFQERGDYQWSAQPCNGISNTMLREMQDMARTITDDLGGAGLFGVEFFVREDEVIFSELSPRPHDTGLVTLFTQRFSEFDLHLRAILGHPVTEESVELLNEGASAVVLSHTESGDPVYEGVEDALAYHNSVKVCIFGKPECRKYRRMGVVLANTVSTAQEAAQLIKVHAKVAQSASSLAG